MPACRPSRSLASASPWMPAVARKTAAEALMMYLMILLPKFRPAGPANPPPLATYRSRARRVLGSRRERKHLQRCRFFAATAMELAQPYFRLRPQTTDFADLVR